MAGTSPAMTELSSWVPLKPRRRWRGAGQDRQGLEQRAHLLGIDQPVELRPQLGRGRGGIACRELLETPDDADVVQEGGLAGGAVDRRTRARSTCRERREVDMGRQVGLAGIVQPRGEFM